MAEQLAKTAILDKVAEKRSQKMWERLAEGIELIRDALAEINDMYDVTTGELSIHLQNRRDWFLLRREVLMSADFAHQWVNGAVEYFDPAKGGNVLKIIGVEFPAPEAPEANIHALSGDWSLRDRG